MIFQKEIQLSNYSRGYHLITKLILDNLPELPENGLLNIFLKHTSAGLTINENADPSVRIDFESFLNQLIPENKILYTHLSEGIDDMPSHIKSSLFGNSLTIPITNKSLNMGIWQGIYFCEFRNNANLRTIIATIYS
ncbi:MAG: YjbQ family protein [Chlorobi bacterium]|nr:YjbQ family protein [Chlorobiota bacterium]